MKKLTLGKRISLGFASVIAVTLALGLIAFNRFLAVSAAGEYLATDPVPGTIAIIDISGAFKENFGLVQMHIGTTAKDNVAAAIQVNKEQIDRLIQQYEATITADKDRAMFAAFKEARMAFVAEFKTVLALSTQGKNTEAFAAVESRMLPAYRQLDSELGKLVEFNKSNLHEGVAQVKASSHGGKITILIGLVAAILAATLTSFAIIRSITKVLKDMTGTLGSSSEQISSAAGQVSEASQTLAEGSSEQAASIEETSSSLEELASMTKRNAENASSAKALSGETRLAAEAGNNDMTEMRQAMEAIKTSSNDIAKIIKTIDEIAFQTNILALNAAVEAARAGEAGAGFAVVADEVRALAQRSANSAKETAAKIEVAIRNGDQGAHISDKVAQSLAVIVGKAREVDELVAEIATASNEQNQGIGQINTAVSQMDKVTQSNASNAEETAAAAEELDAQSISLKEAVGELQRLVGSSTRASSVQTAAPQNKIQPAKRAPAKPKVPASLQKRLTRTAPAVAATNGANGHDRFFQNQ